MNWPQITWLILAGCSLGLALALDGKSRTGKHSFLNTLAGLVFMFWLLWCGGFFPGGQG